MSTIAEMFVSIGADVRQLVNSMKKAGESFSKLGKDAKQASKDVSTSTQAAGKEVTSATKEMAKAYSDAREKLRPFREEVKKAEKQFFDLSQQMGSYKGTNKQFMDEVAKAGQAHKKATDNMLKNNDMMKKSFIQSVGTMLAMSGQSEKIAANFSRMGNPLYTVNNGLLKVTQGLEGMARAGQPAVLALKMLGPNANMKELNDMTRMITAGLMRFQAVALAAAAASAILYTSLFKAAKGPNPADVYKQQADALAAYEEAVKSRTQEIMSAWSLFDKVQLNHPNPNTLIQNLDEQVKALQTWRINLANIASRAGEGFANELAKMGPQSAGEVQTIANMTDSELAKYVDLWRQKMIHARMEATTELEKLKQETADKVKALQETLTPLGLALEPLKGTWAEAFKPMVEVFGMVMTPIVEFLNKIGEMIVKFNEAHPTIAKVIQAFLMLIPIITLLLAPLAIGIGLVAGFQAAWAFVAPTIMPLIGGLAAMSATVWIVIAAIIALVGIFIYLWNTNEGFKNAIITGWTAIKDAAAATWNFILNGILLPVWNAIVAFGMEIWGQFQSFWQENGDSISGIASDVWGFVRDFIVDTATDIMAFLTFAWNIISSVISSVWGDIKKIISGALDIILGVIGLVLSIIQGDWESAWNNVKRIFDGVWKMLEGAARLGADMLLGVIKGIGKSVGGEFEKMSDLFYDAGKGFMDMLVKGLKSMVGEVTSTISDIAGGIRDFLPFSPAKVGPLSDLDKLDFGGPINDSITKGMPIIQNSLNNLLALPSIEANQQFKTENKEASVLNFERMFDGANINVNEKEDIHSLMREFYRFATSKGRGLGVN